MSKKKQPLNYDECRAMEVAAGVVRSMLIRVANRLRRDRPKHTVVVEGRMYGYRNGVPICVPVDIVAHSPAEAAARVFHIATRLSGATGVAFVPGQHDAVRRLGATIERGIEDRADRDRKGQVLPSDR